MPAGHSQWDLDKHKTGKLMQNRRIEMHEENARGKYYSLDNQSLKKTRC
jgi:hypothetical protein